MKKAHYIQACQEFLLQLESLQEDLLKSPDKEYLHQFTALFQNFLTTLSDAFPQFHNNPSQKLICNQIQLLQKHIQERLEDIEQLMMEELTPIKRLRFFEKQYRLKQVLKHHLHSLQSR